MNKPFWRRPLPLPAAAAAGFLACLLSTGCRWFERSALYVPSRTLTAHPGSYGLPFEDLELTAQDGARIHGWYVPAEAGSPVLLLCHGNGGNISHRLQKLLIFRRAGASVLLFDYRGYGRSTGTPTEQGTYRDAEAAYRYLTDQKGVPPERIVLYGESLGAGVAVELSLRRKAAGLILDSAFTSTVEMGKRIFTWLPVRWLVSYKYDNLAKVPKLAVPLLVMHSPDDEMIPFDMGRRLYEAAPGPKTLFEMKGGHNEGFLLTGEPYQQAVAAFLKSLPRGP